MTIEPSRGKMVVKREMDAAKIGKIIRPEEFRRPTCKAEVIAMGLPMMTEMGQDIEVPAKVGETILVELHTGTDIKLGDEEMTVIHQIEVLGVLREDSPVKGL